MAGFNLGDLVGGIGRQLGVGELGVSEWINGQGGADPVKNHVKSETKAVIPTAQFNGPVATDAPKNFSGNVINTNTALGGSGSAGGGASASDLALYDDQIRSLQSLLGRTQTGLDQGLARNSDEYNRNVGSAEADKSKQLSNYEDKRVETNQGKLNSYGTINKNANNGYRSLAQIIGRSAGTGSSAFSELLPDVVGKDTAGKRQEVTETYGRNLQGIDKAQNQYLLDFQGVLDDLARQRRGNEENLRSGIEGQRQNINSQLAQAAAARAQAAGGGAAAARAAAAPFQTAVENSRNQVESFFNQFRNAYTPKQAVAAAPNLNDYTVDRSTINAQGGGQMDAGGGYAEMLRKRLQDSAGVF